MKHTLLYECQTVLFCFITIDSKHIFNLLLNDSEGHLYTVRVGHSMNLVGVQPVQVQDLVQQKHCITFHIWTATILVPMYSCPIEFEDCIGLTSACLNISCMLMPSVLSIISFLPSFVVTSFNKQRVIPLVSMMMAFWACFTTTDVRSKCTLVRGRTRVSCQTQAAMHYEYEITNIIAVTTLILLLWFHMATSLNNMGFLSITYYTHIQYHSKVWD